jgi:hypothetical protein
MGQRAQIHESPETEYRAPSNPPCHISGKTHNRPLFDCLISRIAETAQAFK